MSNVNHPSHYNDGKIEVIEFIEDKKLGFHRGNAVKYIARAGKKDASKELEDLEKAAWYIKREIERLKALKEGREPIRPNDMNPRVDPKLTAVSLSYFHPRCRSSATVVLTSKKRARRRASASRVR